MFRPSPRDFTPAPLPPPFRATITQVDVADLFATENSNFDDEDDLRSTRFGRPFSGDDAMPMMAAALRVA